MRDALPCDMGDSSDPAGERSEVGERAAASIACDTGRVVTTTGAAQVPALRPLTG